MTEDRPALVELSRMAQASAEEAYLDGDLDTYARVLLHADDFTLMPPFGGPTRQGFVLHDEAREATRSTFRGGQVEVEVDASYVTDDLAVLAVVERQRGWWGISLSRTGHCASRSCSDVKADCGVSCTGTQTPWFTPSVGTRSRSSHGASWQSEPRLNWQLLRRTGREAAV